MFAIKLVNSYYRPYEVNMSIIFFCLRTIGDRIGEGKASGNLGNTLKVLGRFDEAVVCCQRHLDISQEQGDKVTSTDMFTFVFFCESVFTVL